MMPKMDGWEVCREVRKNSKVPIIMLTARGDERDELLGFDLGVDEYISKPFSPKILVARVEAILRRSGVADAEDTLSAGCIVIDKAAHIATVDGKTMDLSFKEFELDTNESHIFNGHVPVESKNGESPIKANGRIIAIDGGFSRAYQEKTGIAGYTLIYNSQSLQLVSHEPFTSTEEAIVNESDILSTTMFVEHKLSRKTVKDTAAGKKLLDEVDDLKLLLTAYKKGIIKEV